MDNAQNCDSYTNDLQKHDYIKSANVRESSHDLFKGTTYISVPQSARHKNARNVLHNLLISTFHYWAFHCHNTIT
jgi:hypothetical protein